jgi:nucleotide-binding universal stress UspA family protein
VTVAAVERPPVGGPILLGTDFGPVSAAAERAAIGQAVHAIDTRRLRLPGGRFLMRVDQAREARQRDAAALVERARALGVEATVLIWDGDPASCIIDAAQAEGAAQIVLGSHGRGRIGRAIAGSVSAAVRAQAGCPVAVVRADS